MAFTIKKLKHRPWPVTVKRVVSSEDGVITEVEDAFVAHFKPFDEAEYKALLDRFSIDVKGADGEIKTDHPIADLLDNNAHIFCELLVGWAKVLDDERNPVPFSPAGLRALVTGSDGLAVSTGINKAIAELRFGIAPAKNSQTSVEPGHAPAPAEGSTNSPATSSLSG